MVHAAKFKTKSRRAEVTCCRNFFINMAGIRPGAHNYGYSRTLARSVSIDSFPERSVYGLPFVELENKNYGKRKRGTPGKKKGLFQMTDMDYRHFAPARFAPAMFRYRKQQFASDPTCVSHPIFNFDFHKFYLKFYS